MNFSLACLYYLIYYFLIFISVYIYMSRTLCLAVDSLPLVLKLLCVTQASDPPSASSHSKMDGVHFKLLYHGELNRCCWQVVLSVAVLPTALLY